VSKRVYPILMRFFFLCWMDCVESFR